MVIYERIFKNIKNINKESRFDKCFSFIFKLDVQRLLYPKFIMSDIIFYADDYKEISKNTFKFEERHEIIFTRQYYRK